MMPGARWYSGFRRLPRAYGEFWAAPAGVGLADVGFYKVHEAENP